MEEKRKLNVYTRACRAAETAEQKEHRISQGQTVQGVLFVQLLR